MRSSLSLLTLGLAAGTAVLVAGCSSAGSSSAGSPGTSASPAAKTAPALQGPQLAKILLPVSSLPSGFKADPSATRDTESQLPNDTASPMPASQVCQAFGQTSFIRAAGITTGDFAQSDFMSADQSQEIAEEIDVFTGSDAQKAMTTLWNEFGKCASFSSSSNGATTTNTLKRSKLSGTGDEAIKAVSTSPAFQGGETIVAVRTGSTIITTLYSSSGSDLGSPAVGYAQQILQRLQAAK